MSREVAIRKLMQACEKDPELFARLTQKPHEVAEEYGVTLEPDEVAQLERVQKLNSLVAEFKQGRGIGTPIGYPVDVAWKTAIANHIVFYRPIYYPIFYPAYGEALETAFHRLPGSVIKGYPWKADEEVISYRGRGKAEGEVISYRGKAEGGVISYRGHGNT
jgi:hypothetical protein